MILSSATGSSSLPASGQQGVASSSDAPASSQQGAASSNRVLPPASWQQGAASSSDVTEAAQYDAWAAEAAHWAGTGDDWTGDDWADEAAQYDDWADEAAIWANMRPAKERRRRKMATPAGRQKASKYHAEKRARRDAKRK